MNNDRTKSSLVNVMIYSIILILIFWGLEYLRDFIPPNLYEDTKEGIQIKTIGLLIVIGMIFYCIAVTKEINKNHPVFSEIKAALLCSFAFIITELAFKIIQGIFTGFESAFYYYQFWMPLYCLVLGFSISFMTIHKIRGHNIQKLVVIYFILFISLGYIVRYFN